MILEIKFDISVLYIKVYSYCYIQNKPIKIFMSFKKLLNLIVKDKQKQYIMKKEDNSTDDKEKEPRIINGKYFVVPKQRQAQYELARQFLYLN